MSVSARASFMRLTVKCENENAHYHIWTGEILFLFATINMKIFLILMGFFEGILNGICVNISLNI